MSAPVIMKIVKGMGDNELVELHNSIKEELAGRCVEAYKQGEEPDIDFVMTKEPKPKHTSGGGKKKRVWMRKVTGCDYDAKPDGYAISGDWFNPKNGTDFGDLILAGVKWPEKKYILFEWNSDVLEALDAGDEVESITCIRSTDKFSEIVKALKARKVPQVDSKKKEAA